MLSMIGTLALTSRITHGHMMVNDRDKRDHSVSLVEGTWRLKEG